MKKNQFILYGLSTHKQIIEKIISDLNAYNDIFNIRLILTEALTNAFVHGNKSDKDKPIYMRYFYDGIKVQFEIEDSGNEFKNVIIPDKVSDEQLLDSYGRGLFLIKCIADKVELKNNILSIQKSLITQGKNFEN